MRAITRAIMPAFLQERRDAARRDAVQATFGSNVNLAAARRVSISSTHNFLYNRIQKNANSSLMVFMYRAHTNRVTSVIRSRQNVPHLSTTSIRSIPFLGGYRRLIVIRNPYSRVLSAFLDKFRHEHIIARHGRFDLSPAGFGSFLDWLENGGMGGNSHWDLQVNQMLLPLDAYSDIIRFETLAQDMTRFVQSFENDRLAGIGDSLFAHGRRHATGASDKILEFYDGKRFEKVAKLYKRDFEALGYDAAGVGGQSH